MAQGGRRLIVVSNRGPVSFQRECGELVARRGIYADLWSRQSGGFIADEVEKEEAAE